MAELIERILAALIVIVLLGIVLYLAMEGRVISVQRAPTPSSPPVAGEVQYAKKEDRLPEAAPSELRRDSSRSPTIVVREEAPPPRVIRETVRPTESRREHYREYRTSREYRPVKYREPVRHREAHRDRTVHKTYRYYDDDCVGRDCACTCEAPYWSSSGPICSD